MAFTLKEIGAYLKKNKMSFDIDKEKEILTLGMSDGTEKGALFIRAKEEGKIFSLEMEPMNDVKKPLDIPNDHPHLNLVLPQLLFANYKTKFGTWEYDPSDGDLKFSIEFPIEDGTITQQQFERVLSGVNTAFEYQAKFRHILETGALPTQEDELAQFKTLLDTMLEQMQAQKASGEEDKDGI